MMKSVARDSSEALPPSSFSSGGANLATGIPRGNIPQCIFQHSSAPMAIREIWAATVQTTFASRPPA